MKAIQNIPDLGTIKLNETEDALIILDQTLLPTETRYLKIHKPEDVWEAIHLLRVRGAPAIGVTAAYGLYLGVMDVPNDDRTGFQNAFHSVRKYLASSRPTAVNLFWALERMERCYQANASEPVSFIKKKLLNEATILIIPFPERKHRIFR